MVRDALPRPAILCAPASSLAELRSPGCAHRRLDRRGPEPNPQQHGVPHAARNSHQGDATGVTAECLASCSRVSLAVKALRVCLSWTGERGLVGRSCTQACVSIPGTCLGALSAGSGGGSTYCGTRDLFRGWRRRWGRWCGTSGSSESATSSTRSIPTLWTTASLRWVTLARISLVAEHGRATESVVADERQWVSVD